MTHLTGLTEGVEKSWSTVQCGVGVKDHIELNSVFVFSGCLSIDLAYRVFLTNPSEPFVRAERCHRPQFSKPHRVACTRTQEDQSWRRDIILLPVNRVGLTPAV